MMKRLRAMREPLKYVQGRDALLQFKKEMGYMGKRWLFICSRSGYKASHEKIEVSFGSSDDYRRYEIFGGISSKDGQEINVVVPTGNFGNILAAYYAKQMNSHLFPI